MVLARKLRRPKALAAAALLLFASIIPLFVNNSASAYGLIQSRQIKISSSVVGTETAGQDVQYEVSFNVATDTQDIAGIVVEFCSNSPILGDSCTAPAGFDLDTAGGDGTALAYSSASIVSGFTVDTTNSTANKLIISGTAVNPTALENVLFTLGGGADDDGITNPSALGTFYARIVTYTTAAGAIAYTSTVLGNDPVPVIDAGGIALSTAEQITVTSKVQETLTFCIYTTGGANNDCTGTGADVVLGDENGVLDTAGPFVDITTKYNVATNASNDVAIRIKGDTLETGSFNIEAIGAAAAASNAGNEQFGFCTYTDVGSVDPLTLAPDAPYNNAACNSATQTAGPTGGGTPGGEGTAQFAFDTAETTSTYGDLFATKQAGDFSTGIIAFIGNIANTTEAGIYSTTLIFIATGTY